MIRKLIASLATAALLSVGMAAQADAARFRPESTSYTAMAFFYRCGEYQHSPHTRGWLVRTRIGYQHVNTQPFSFVAECAR